MKVFITGGSGYLGSAVVRALVAAGHEVFALARRSSAASALEALGARPLLGDVGAPETFVSQAAACDGILHLAQASGPGRGAIDRAVVEALLAAARGAGAPRFFGYTSVLFVLGPVSDEVAVESSIRQPPGFMAPRAAIEDLVLAAAGGELVTAVLRPGMVYGGGLGGMVSELFQSAIDEGASVFIGDGANRWSLIHRDDAASLFVLALERRAGGIFHAVDGTPLSVRAIAEAASRAAGRGGAVRRLDLDLARAELGDFAAALCLDQPVSAPAAQALGWEPRWPQFLDAAPRAFAELETARRSAS